jgi:protein-tyrosine phosphatase
MEAFREYDLMNEVYPRNPASKKGGVWVGNLLAAQDIEELKNCGINHVVTALHKLRVGDLGKQLVEAGIKVKHIDVHDSEEGNMYQFFEDACKFIDGAVKNGNVLIHCFVGISRSSTLCVAWLMKKKKKGWVEMLEYVKKRRPYCHPNDGFKVQLAKWERKLGIVVSEGSSKADVDTGPNDGNFYRLAK